MIISNFYPNQIIRANCNPLYEYIVFSIDYIEQEISIKAYKNLQENSLLNLESELLQHCRDFSIFSVSPDNINPSIFSDDDIFTL